MEGRFHYGITSDDFRIDCEQSIIRSSHGAVVPYPKNLEWNSLILELNCNSRLNNLVEQ